MKILELLSLFSKIPYFLDRLELLVSGLNRIQTSINELNLALGRIECRQLEKEKRDDLRCYEFKVSSQWGEDGIIQFLINQVQIKKKIFIEFGVENYIESNTRFLLQNNNWTGLIFDGSSTNISFIKNDPLYWKYNLKAECAFIDCENINSILIKNGFEGDIGLLSIDIDGNDYWVWEAIQAISPRIVICEYNSLFGPIEPVSVPYNQFFNRTKAHYSNLYYGASIAALNYLAQKKGYSLVGGNSAGNNIFFVRNDVIGNLPVKSVKEAYVQAQLRESRDENGQLTYLDFDERFKLISEMPIINVTTNSSSQIKELKQ